MRDRLATESEEERAVRHQQMRDRLASETEEERAARLQRECQPMSQVGH